MLLATVAAFLLTIALFACAPTAQAKSYAIPEVAIDATVNADGSLHVVEARTFDFDGEFARLAFSIDPPYGGSVAVNAMWMGDPNDVDQNGNVVSTPLKRISFNLDWREDGGPAESGYSFDSPRNTVYAFFDAVDEQVTFTLDYTVEDALGVWADVGELYWSYLGRWEADSENVELTVHLPVPAGSAAVAGENVFAWGHGPSDGTVAINEDGSVTFRCARVGEEQYAAARVLFPIEWLSDVSQETRLVHQGDERLETVVAEEESWTDQAAASGRLALTVIMALAVLTALLLAWTIVTWALHGKEHKPRFTDPLLSELPEPDAHPAVVGRLWRFDSVRDADLAATVARLLQMGAVQLEGEPGGGLALVCVPERAELAKHPVDRAALALLFDQLAQGEDRLRMDAIDGVAAQRPAQFVAWLRAWQRALSDAVEAREFFEPKGNARQVPFVVLGSLCVLGGIIAWQMLGNLIPALFMVPAGVAIVVMGANMPRRSQEASDLCAKCEALRTWLRTLDAQGEDLPTDARTWGKLMPYAQALGVEDEAVRALRTKVPSAFEETEGEGGTGTTPWWRWHCPTVSPDGKRNPAGEDVFADRLAQAHKTARQALAAEHRKSISPLDGPAEEGAAEEAESLLRRLWRKVRRR